MLTMENKHPTTRETNPTVFCVIPVFNRIDATRICIRCLKQQTYRPLVIIVADGGSTDGTIEILNNEHPDVIVLESAKQLWWGGATRLGIEWALQHSTTNDDFVMMVNNDTEFEPDYVQTLMTHAKATGAAIGGIVVDEDNPDNIVDAGVRLEWDSYLIYGVKDLPKDGTKLVKSAFLPGRGTVVPVQAIRAAGNVDDRNFPHYISDYEFTYRLSKKANIPLYLATDAIIRTPMDTQPVQLPYTNPFAETAKRVRSLWNRRSKSNIVDHYRFIDRHAPRSKKLYLKGLFCSRQMFWTLAPITRPLTRPLRSAIKSLARRLTYAALFAICPVQRYPLLIPRHDFEAFGVNEQDLVKAALVEPTDITNAKGYYEVVTGDRGSTSQPTPQAQKLLEHANTNGPRLVRIADVSGLLFERLPESMPVWQTVLRTLLCPGQIREIDCQSVELSAADLLDKKHIRQVGTSGFYQLTDAGIYEARNSLAMNALLIGSIHPFRNVRRKMLG